ncbi:hypothetical protein PYCC9005_000136 [Savitreella phatthalungensis]
MVKSVFLLLTAFVACVLGSAMTLRVKANDKTCSYAWVDRAGEKISFYFAVQSGGDFDIDYTVKDPQQLVVMSGEKERQGDFAFTAMREGEYEFCLNNGMSSVTDKDVDIEVQVESEPRSEMPVKPGASADSTTGIEESVLKISMQTSQISRMQKYFRTRENRNMSTVQSTESRIFWFAVLESVAMVAASFLQVFVVRTFFSRRNAVKV